MDCLVIPSLRCRVEEDTDCIRSGIEVVTTRVVVLESGILVPMAMSLRRFDDV